MLPFEEQVQVISALIEGCSIRSTERLTNVNRNTIMSLSLRVGEGCERLHDRMMRDLQVNLIELDEQWDFVAKKPRHVKDGDPESYGDAWVFIALASTQPQITSDGYAPYIGAVEAAFGTAVDYAQITKKYVSDSSLPDAAHRYSPGHVSHVDRTVIRGIPKSENISTSYVERFNLSSRMQMRRFTRLTNGFSKKLESHRTG